jgi:hypothetical protein
VLADHDALAHLGARPLLPSPEQASATREKLKNSQESAKKNAMAVAYLVKFRSCG